MRKESVSSFSQRENYAPSGFTRFLWWLATAEDSLLKDCTVDRNRYSIIGLTVMGTWLFATLAWTYFFSTVVSNLFVAAILGIFMGGIILGIDRALIKGIDKHNKRKVWPFIFRGLLAVTIGIFMAQPALLYLFNKEVKQQISVDNEQRKRDKRKQQDTLYAAQKSELQARKQSLQQQLTTKYNEVSAAREGFIAETDGTGGTGKIGVAAVAAAKKKEYEKLDHEYQQLNTDLQPQIRAADSSLASIEVSIQNEQKAFNELMNDGFLTRIEALNNLIKSNSALQYRYYLLVVILLLIELMPVIAKTLLPAGVYDEKVRLRQEQENLIATSNNAKEIQLKEMYNQLAFEHDEKIINSFFETTQDHRKEKVAEELKAWKDGGGSFDKFWSKIKRDLLTKQEH
jgi:phosphate/sulfate permease